jgi:hypothetical protein
VGGLDGVLEPGQFALEGGRGAGGEQLAYMLLDAPRDGQLDVLPEDLGEPFPLPQGQPVPGAGEQLAVLPRGVDVPTAASVQLPDAAAPDLGAHLVGQAHHVPVVQLIRAFGSALRTAARNSLLMSIPTRRTRRRQHRGRAASQVVTTLPRRPSTPVLRSTAPVSRRITVGLDRPASCATRDTARGSARQAVSTCSASRVVTRARAGSWSARSVNVFLGHSDSRER